MEPNTSLDLERFVSLGNSGNRFKFIQKTQEIIDHRGDRADDGIIRIEIKYEKKAPVHVDTYHHDHYDHHHDHYHWDHYPWYPSKPWIHYGSGIRSAEPHYNVMNTTIGSSNAGGGNTTSSSNDGPISFSMSSSLGNFKGSESVNYMATEPLQDEGITVKGSESHQSFTYGNIGELEPNSDVIILRLKGISGGVSVREPVTVKTKFVCPTCGRSNKLNNRYCANCGTYLS